jgi:hypothetical protein
MQKRSLGQDGLEVSASGPGSIGMSSGYGPAGDRQEMVTLIQTAVEQVLGFGTPLRFAGSSDLRWVTAVGGGGLCGVRCGRSRGPTWRPRRGFGRRVFA